MWRVSPTLSNGSVTKQDGVGMIATMPPSFVATNDEREPNFKARRAKWDTREKEYNTNVVYIRNTPLSNMDFMLYSLILGILNIVLSRRRPTSTVLYLEIVVSFSRLGRGGCGREIGRAHV